MRTLFTAATGLPTLLFTAALLVAACFWVLVAVRAAAVDSFDADVNLDPLGMGGVPVAVALSLLSALAWTLALGAALLLDAIGLTGLAGCCGWRRTPGHCSSPGRSPASCCVRCGVCSPGRCTASAPTNPACRGPRTPGDSRGDCGSPAAATCPRSTTAPSEHGVGGRSRPA
jgi:hypothetical protein